MKWLKSVEDVVCCGRARTVEVFGSLVFVALNEELVRLLQVGICRYVKNPSEEGAPGQGVSVRGLFLIVGFSGSLVMRFWGFCLCVCVWRGIKLGRVLGRAEKEFGKREQG